MVAQVCLLINCPQSPGANRYSTSTKGKEKPPCLGEYESLDDSHCRNDEKGDDRPDPENVNKYPLALCPLIKSPGPTNLLYLLGKSCV